MPAVKKIRRIPSIERKRLKSRERSEKRRSPLPTVAQQILHSECARACGMCRHRLWIPMRGIEIAARSLRTTVAPRVDPLRGIIRHTVRRAMPLRLGRKRFPGPPAERGGLRIADVDRTIQGQRNFLE